ncbi:MAG: DUF116 domain-containing protein [Methanobrevibacter sp.]|jgi:hypothetical protein|nr:DUF116 domain-containing protein [Candidatus Methanovirga procula]
MFSGNLFQTIGQIAVTFVISLIIILILSLILGIILLKKNTLIFPRLVLFALDFLYSPLKKLSKTLGFDEIMVDHIGVEIRNQINENNFKDIDNKKKILVFPHCLRDPNCEATLNETGLVCSSCGKCAIGVIKPKAEKIGYKVFIVPGSTFVNKIVEENDFDAVLGIACYEDLNKSMMKLSNFNPQGVLLSRSGCFKTAVDVKTVLDKIGYYDIFNDDKIKIVNPCSKNDSNCFQKDKDISK